MSWSKKNEYVSGVITLSVFLNEKDADFDEVIKNFSREDFVRLVIVAGTFTDLNILAACASKLESLMIQTVSASFSGIEKLTMLKELHCDVESEKPFPNFGALINLEKCLLDWSKKYDTSGYSQNFFSLPKLKDLTLRHWSKENCKDISQLKSLERLVLRQASLTSLDGLQYCINLKDLSLGYNSKLITIDAIRGSQNIEKVRIVNCQKISDLDPLLHLRSLRELHIEKVGVAFENLDGLANATLLEKICISAEIRKIDWEMLFNHPSLCEVIISSCDNYPVLDSEILSVAKSATRTIVGFNRGGTKKRPSFSFNLQ